MSDTSLNFCKALSEELDPERLQRTFLKSLLNLQKVERGSIWVKKGNGYLCVEAFGSQSEKVRGITISANHPSIVGWVIENGRMTIGEPGKDARHFKEIEESITVKSRLILCFPLFLRGGEVYGAVQLIDTMAGGSRINLDKEHLDLLQQLIDIGSIALSNSLVYTHQVKENQKLKQVLQIIRSEETPLGMSEAFIRMMRMTAEYAKTDFPVLITGESGTGKELIAKEIHRMSSRTDKPFLVQNCSAIPETLLESELFGYEKGAFTGATRDKVGIFEAAHGGTIFLDEIGDMPTHLQARILRVLQNSEIKPLGGTKTREIDVRVISATNKDLKEAILHGEFREDLFYRLNVLPLHLPPLRERREDIPFLLDHFIRREAHRIGRPPKTISPEATEYLVAHPWKGNIRELENFVKHIVVTVPAAVVTYDDIQPHFAEAQHSTGAGRNPDASFPPRPESKTETIEAPSTAPGICFDGRSWEEVERAYVLHLLEKNRWHITRAAKEAGLNRSTFDSRMKKLGIRK